MEARNFTFTAKKRKKDKSNSAKRQQKINPSVCRVSLHTQHINYPPSVEASLTCFIKKGYFEAEAGCEGRQTSKIKTTIL